MLRRYLVQLSDAVARTDARGLRATRKALQIAACTVRHGASPNNYTAFGFDALSTAGRGEYLTHRHNQRLISTGIAVEPLRDKLLFSTHFHAYTGRRTISLSDISLQDASDLVRETGSGWFLKPRFEGQGRGVTRLTEGDLQSGGALPSIWSSQQRENWILDECLTQDKQLSSWVGSGLAPVRIVTGVANPTRSEVLWAAITVGRGGDAVNYHLGGIMTPIDIASGRLVPPGIDKSGTLLREHPVSGKPLDEIALPRWTDVIALANEAALHNPAVRYCGWDIGITDNGPFLIEGNHDPGTYAMVQRAEYRAAIGGLYSVARDVFPDLLN